MTLERELAAEGVELGPGELLIAARRVVAGDVTKTAAFREGRVRIQDEGSQLIAELAAAGQKILDCCAAPGGKTLILGERNPKRKLWRAMEAISALRICGSGSKFWVTGWNAGLPM